MQGRARPGAMNATLVAFYGEKPPHFAAYVSSIQSLLANRCSSFKPYDVAQVHATLVGLEGIRQGNSSEVVNDNYRTLRGERRVMDLDWVARFVRETSLLPFEVQVGGFEKQAPYPFTSRAAHPQERSFTIQSTRAVGVGWPRERGTYPPTLARLRRAFEPAGVLHRYHESADGADDDNDLFFVVGTIEGADVSELELRDVHMAVREHMANHELSIEVDANHVHVTCYVDPALPIETSVRFDIGNIETARLLELYRSS